MIAVLLCFLFGHPTWTCKKEMENGQWRWEEWTCDRCKRTARKPIDLG